MIPRAILILNDASEVVQYESMDSINREFSKFTSLILKYNVPNPIEASHWARFAY